MLVKSVIRAFCPPPELEGLATSSGFATPASLEQALASSPRKATKRDAFTHSFVLQTGADVWGDEACTPLVRLLGVMGTLGGGGGDAGWLAKWAPLTAHQHGDLNAANILVDVHDGIWLIDFAKSGMGEPFVDAAKIISCLLFEYYPVPMAFAEARRAPLRQHACVSAPLERASASTS